MAKRWLSRQWLELTGCYVVDLQPVSSIQHAAGYLAKYLAKDPAVPAGHRRWRRTAGFFNRSAEPPTEKLPVVSKWQIMPGSIRSQALIWLNERKALFFHPAGYVKALDSPQLWAAQVDQGLREKLLTAMTGPEMAALTKN